MLSTSLLLRARLKHAKITITLYVPTNACNTRVYHIMWIRACAACVLHQRLALVVLCVVSVFARRTLAKFMRASTRIYTLEYFTSRTIHRSCRRSPLALDACQFACPVGGAQRRLRLCVLVSEPCKLWSCHANAHAHMRRA